ncbi:hypothetical protein ABT095_38595 [Kitasatospora sp. NPDC002227]|uniref:hypothetical protein n=1 Tax=Kitasatospora sp. NPDC002227 TaxID=3154773 RepID=UPI003325A44E
MEFEPELLIEALESDAHVQSLKAELARALSLRDAKLYGLWRAAKDPAIVAAHMGRSVTSRTVRSAVLKLAPREDFVQPQLFETVSQSPKVELAA